MRFACNLHKRFHVRFDGRCNYLSYTESWPFTRTGRLTRRISYAICMQIAGECDFVSDLCAISFLLSNKYTPHEGLHEKPLSRTKRSLLDPAGIRTRTHVNNPRSCRLSLEWGAFTALVILTKVISLPRVNRESMRGRRWEREVRSSCISGRVETKIWFD
jgi:hypothetical protein